MFDEFAGVLAVPARIPTRSFGEEMSPPWFDPMPTSKLPSAMVRSVSHVPTFEGYFCPGVSILVPADGGLSSVSSGFILPSSFSSISIYTSGGISGLSEGEYSAVLY